MKSMKPSFYVMILVVFLALLYVVYFYKDTVDGFRSTEIRAHFQNMPAEQKEVVCKTLNEQITAFNDQMKALTPEQKVEMQKSLEEMQKTATSYGC
jgi:Ca2+/Na+ antiporter